MKWLRVDCSPAAHPAQGQDHKVTCDSPLSCVPRGTAHPTHDLDADCWMGIRRCRRAMLANHLGVYWASMGIGSGEVPLRQPCPLTCSYHGLMHEGTRASALRCVSMTACESGRGPLVGADELRRARRRVPSHARGRGPRQAPLGLTAARVCRSACSFVAILSLAGLRASARLDGCTSLHSADRPDALVVAYSIAGVQECVLLRSVV